ncbi:MAG: LysR family transcriptional regulator [Verrucomicrobiota bacterium]
MIDPEIRELQCFLALNELGSFSAAAHKLGVTQPAVSVQILKLEQILGFPLFYRSPEGTVMTEEGIAILPVIEEVVGEYSGLLNRIAYWQRSQAKQVKIRADSSRLAQEIQKISSQQESPIQTQAWSTMDVDRDWVAALRDLEVDLVVAGSFRTAGVADGISSVVIRRDRGITVAWNPRHHAFEKASLSMPELISSTVILPAASMAVGFREFMSGWCESLYGLSLATVIECQSDHDALDACKQGLGVLMFPGDAATPMNLAKHGLETVRALEFSLPGAFTFGVHHRTNEQNPAILAMARRLAATVGGGL